jgi:trigger factor
METKVEKLKQSRVRTTTVIDEASRATAEAAALVRLSEQVEIKGFRVGKAPADKVKERVGADRLLEETVRELLPVVLKDALEKTKAKPMLRPAANVVSMSPLTISLTFVERPEVTVKKRST